jgi:hypothetical protein
MFYIPRKQHGNLRERRCVFGRSLKIHWKKEISKFQNILYHLENSTSHKKTPIIAFMFALCKMYGYPDFSKGYFTIFVRKFPNSRIMRMRSLEELNTAQNDTNRSLISCTS